MPWVYHQGTGALVYNDETVATGYAGANAGRNNPAAEALRNIGPIPRGSYEIGRPRNTARRGPHAMDLTPSGHNALGRTEFMIHGDSIANPGQASEGCIVLPRNARERISGSGDNVLVVVE